MGSNVPLEIETPNLTVRMYLRDPDRVIVVFVKRWCAENQGFAEGYHNTSRTLLVARRSGACFQ